MIRLHDCLGWIESLRINIMYCVSTYWYFINFENVKLLIWRLNFMAVILQ